MVVDAVEKAEGKLPVTAEVIEVWGEVEGIVSIAKYRWFGEQIMQQQIERIERMDGRCDGRGHGNGLGRERNKGHLDGRGRADGEGRGLACGARSGEGQGMRRRRRAEGCGRGVKRRGSGCGRSQRGYAAQGRGMGVRSRA